MSNQRSTLALLAPLILIVIAGFAYYAKYHWARTWVDERYPWIKENIGSRLPPLVIAVDAEGRPVGEEASAPTERTSSAESETAGAITPSPKTARNDYLSSNGAVDLQRLAADPASWPKTVTLRKPREFPAVVNGRVVGKVEASAGTEARLVAVQAGKLGLEFRGGGAWVTAEETDLATRLRGIQRH